MELLIGQVYTFTMMFIFGLLLGLGFDIYRRLLQVIKFDKIWTNLADLFFWILAGGAGLITLIYANWGEFRFYVILAIFLGFALYFYFLKFLKWGND